MEVSIQTVNFWLWHHTILEGDIDVSDKQPAFIFRDELHWIWK
jgi:hypothetical protein